MRRSVRHLVILVVAAAVLGACARTLPPRVDPPATGTPEIGVAYAAVTYCAVPMKLGDAWWGFDEPLADWPADITIPPFPLSIWANVSSPYAVPGIVTLTAEDSAIFRADVDGSEFPLTRHPENPNPGHCL